jgi:hypothetical protein
MAVTTLRDYTAESILEHLGDLENYPKETLVTYEEFLVDDKTYYFTPGGFLYRKDPGTEEVGGFFCGYLTDEVWHYRTARCTAATTTSCVRERLGLLTRSGRPSPGVEQACRGQEAGRAPAREPSNNYIRSVSSFFSTIEEA